MPKKSKLFRLDIRDKIMRVITTGASIDMACDYAGVHPSSYYNKQKWLNEELKTEWQSFLYENEDYQDMNLSDEIIEALEFFESIKKAIATCKVSLMAKIRADDSWQSSAWLLERRFPDEFGKQITPQKQEKVEFNIADIHLVVNRVLEQFSSIPNERLVEIANKPRNKY